jgi:septum formation protein
LDARAILGHLRGKRHQVITGLAVLDSKRNEIRVSSVATWVYMREYSEQDIEEYVGSAEPMDKAGAYAIQGKGGELVSSIDGCYFNVVGFPLCEVARMLQGFQVRLSAPGPACTLPNGRTCPREVGR